MEDESLGKLVGELAPTANVARLSTLAKVRAKLFGAPERPVTFGRYVLLKRLGAGAGGVVHVAYDPELDRKVAIKLLHPGEHASGSSESSVARDRLVREAQAMAKVAHPNVVSVHDVGTYDEAEFSGGPGALGEADGRGVFVVMELVDGEELGAWREAQPRSWRDVLEVFLGAGTGLMAAHTAGLIHRDFKPSNVLIGTDGRARVLDFGLARSAPRDADEAVPEAVSPSDPGVTLTRAGTIMGTPAYMSPEQHRGESASPRSDQYAYCASLWEAIYGSRAFTGKTIRDLATAKESGPGTPPARAGVPGWLGRALVRGLATRPEDRFPDMASLLMVLRRGSRQRARRRLYFGIAALVVGGVVASAFAARASRNAACADQDLDLAGVWDPEVKSRVRNHFLATNAPYAADAFAVVERNMDAFAQHWVRERTQTCRAAMVEGTRTLTEMSQQMLCLDRLITRVGGVTRGLASADAVAMRGAAQAMASLPDLATCDPVRASDPSRPAVDRDALLKVETSIADVEALIQAGKYDEAWDRGEAASAEANELGDPGSIARAQYQLGRIELLVDRPEQAEARLRTARVTAERAGDDRQVVEILTDLVALVGPRQQRHEEALQLARLGHARLERAHLGDRLAAPLVYQEGRVWMDQGQHARARETLARARDLAEASGGPDDPTAAGAINAIGLTYDREWKNEDALAHYREALERRQRIYGVHHPAYGVSLGNVGIMLYRVEEFEDALATLEEAISVLDAALGPEHRNAALHLGNLGVVLATQGRLTEALERLQAAARITRKAMGSDHPQLARTLTDQVNVLLLLRRPEEALVVANEAVAIFEKAPGDRLRPIALQYQGAALSRLKRYDEAMVALEEGLALTETNLGATAPGLVPILREIGLVWVSREDFARARPVLERALRIDEATSGDAETHGFILFLLAQATWPVRPQRARELAKQARSAMRGSIVADASDRATVDAWLEAHKL